MRAVRVCQLLIVVSLLVPAALFAGVAAIDLADVEREAQSDVLRTVRVMHEHARKVFEAEELVLARIADRIAGMSDQQVAEPGVSAFLHDIKTPFEQEVSAWITDASGNVLAGSQPWDPGGGLAGRDFFDRQRESDLGLYVSRRFRGKATGVESFAISRRRPSRDGSFVGTLHVAISPAYFRRFFAEASPSPLYVGVLVRADGEILAREPERPDQQQIGTTSSLLQAISQHPEGGLYSGTSTYDREIRISGFRKVGAYPVYVRFGIPRSVILDEWFHNLWLYAIVVAPGAVLLLLFALLALNRARAEETALARLHEEIDQRLKAEERLRHKQRLEALGQLAGGIAHDFNNILQTITGSAALIEKRVEDASAVRRFAQMIQESARRGASVTGRLLTFARRSDLRAAPIVAETLLLGLQEILHHSLGSNIALQVEAEPELPPLLADSAQLEMVLVNLATNARDAMPDGGVLTLAALIDVPPAGYDALAGRRYVRISVTDTGTGMDAELVARATDPFFTTKPQGKGTGLGLAMARGFAEQSGGLLQIESEPGRGTTVSLWLPVASGSSGAAFAVRRPTEPDGAPPRVLLVENERTIGLALAGDLTDAGFDVIYRESGIAALNVLSERTIDVLVTDLAMPAMNGLELINAIKSLYPAVPAILLTGYAGDGASLAVGAAVDGLFTLLRKPVTGQDLADAINALLHVPAEIAV